MTDASAPADVPPDDDTDACPLCGGAGFVRRQRALDDPLFGRAEPCSCVLGETAEARKSRLARIGNLGALHRFTFSTFRAESSNGTQALETAREFASAPVGWLVIDGPSGAGKTHLAASIANARVAAGEPALFLSVPDLLDHLRAGYQSSDDDESYDRLFEQVRTAPFLVLDDIDAAAPTPWAREKLFQLVNGRYNEGLPTVFTTGAGIEPLDSRFATRIADASLAKRLVLGRPAGASYVQVGGMTRERLDRMRFRTFDPRGAGLAPEERQSLEAAFRTASAYADHPEGWLLIQGTNGCGKTHLAAAIANRVLDGGTDVVFVVVPDLLDELRRAFNPAHDQSEGDLFQRAREASLLVLDDLGAQVASPWVQEKLYQLVNYRTVAGLPTVVTSDQSDSELLNAHPRLMARIADPRNGDRIAILAPHYSLGTRPARRASR